MSFESPVTGAIRYQAPIVPHWCKPAETSLWCYLSGSRLHLAGSVVKATRLAAARLAVIVWWALFSLVPSTSRGAAAPITLKVEASNALRGFSRTELSRYLASHMAEAKFTDWRFEAAEDGPAPDRVEWSFKRNPYAGEKCVGLGRRGEASMYVVWSRSRCAYI